MDGGVAQKFGNLGEVQVISTDQLSGKADLQLCEILNDPAAVFLAEHILESGSADQVVVADLFDADRLADMLLQIVDDLAAGGGGDMGVN